MSRKKRGKVVDFQTAEEYKAKTIKKTFHIHDLKGIQPKTPSQADTFQAYSEGYNLVLMGCAGTGKTLLAVYHGLLDVLDPRTPYDTLFIVRSTVPSRDIGFLPGTEAEKIQIYEQPYHSICDELFDFRKSYENLKKNGYVEFLSTSFIRGLTLNNAVVVFDEAQNATFEELSSVITRVGSDCKIIFCGDTAQNDLYRKKSDISGFPEFIRIIDRMSSFDIIEYGIDDIVRSGVVREFLVAKSELGI